MDENTNATQEPAADLTDAFLNGWDEPDTDIPADLPETAASENTETSDAEPNGAETGGDTALNGVADAVQSAGNLSGGPSQSSSTTDPSEVPQLGAAPVAAEVPVWKFAYMQQEQTIARDDPRIPGMISKGLDYDRIRAKYDEAKPVMEMFGEFAKSAGMSVQDYVRAIRTEAKKAGGLSDDEAKRVVALEEREAAIAAQESARHEAEAATRANQERVRRDLDDFAAAFPDVFQRAKGDKTAIPPEVWAEVNRGATLTAAYAKYAVAQAQAATQAETLRADTAVKNNENSARSTGSMLGAGNSAKQKDAFLVGFEEE
ncbi:MAG: hypothetical protein IJ783_06300 [Kiritimatiellae bacterium]|nr:hypothetical protein [Kiritimatiellia bacterium]